MKHLRATLEAAAVDLDRRARAWRRKVPEPEGRDPADTTVAYDREQVASQCESIAAACRYLNTRIAGLTAMEMKL